MSSGRWFEQKVAQWQEKNRRVSFYLKINIFVAKKHKYVNLNAKKACFLTAKASQSDF